MTYSSIEAGGTREASIPVSDMELTADPYVFLTPMFYAIPGATENVVLAADTTNVLIRTRNTLSGTANNVKIHVLIVGAF